MDLQQFLKKRGVEKAHLNKLQEDKIDIDAAKCMTDEELAAYIPAKGDRLALRSFLSPQTQTDGKKHRLFDTLREKMMLRNRRVVGDESDTALQKKHLEGNKNASKSSRKLELGWIHEGRQVRKKNGGGTRNIIIPKTATKKEILEKCKNLFFPNGKAKGFQLEKLSCDIFDFKETPFPDNVTVGELYDEVKMGILRFYLSTTSNESCTETEISDNSSLPDPSMNGNDEHVLQHATHNELLNLNTLGDGSALTNFEPDESPVPPYFADPVESSSPLNFADNEKQGPMNCVSDEGSGLTSYNEQASSSSFTNTLGIHVPGILIHPYTSDFCVDSASSIDPVQHLEVANTYVDIGFNLENNSSRLSTPVSEFDITTLTVHRVNIVEEMVGYFKSRDILNKDIAFKFIGEAGSDERGVSREVYSAFWADFLNGQADGEESRVPAINTKWQEEEWNSVGRILVKGFRDHSVYPLKLNKCFTVALILGEQHVFPEMLLDSFMTFICHNDKDLLNCVIENGVIDDIKEDFLDFLDRFGHKSIPTHKEEVKSQLIHIAHSHLIQKPKYPLDKMRAVSQENLQTLLPSISNIDAMYELKKPTAKRILHILEASPNTPDESKALGYLQQFIRAQRDEMLQKLLRFFTGADSMCVDKIEISFVNISGFGRGIIAHTCGPTIELPSTYQSYPEFRKEIESQLSNAETFRMEIA